MRGGGEGDKGSCGNLRRLAARLCLTCQKERAMLVLMPRVARIVISGNEHHVNRRLRPLPIGRPREERERGNVSSKARGWQEADIGDCPCYP